MGYIASAFKAKFINPSTSIFPTALTKSEFVKSSKKTNYDDHNAVISRSSAFSYLKTWNPNLYFVSIRVRNLMARQIPQEEVRVRSPLPTSPPFYWTKLYFSRAKWLAALVELTHNKLRGLFDVPLNMSSYPPIFFSSVSPLKFIRCRDSWTSQHNGDVLNRNNTILRWETVDEGG